MKSMHPELTRLAYSALAAIRKYEGKEEHQNEKNEKSGREDPLVLLIAMSAMDSPDLTIPFILIAQAMAWIYLAGGRLGLFYDELIPGPEDLTRGDIVTEDNLLYTQYMEV